MRPPDLVVGSPENPYMHRWVLWRDGEGGAQVCLHKIWRSDDDRALHDHRADNISIILPFPGAGWYTEVLSHAWETWRAFDRWPLIPYFRRAGMPHRLIVRKPVWTIWIRFRGMREWGYWRPKGWRHWRDYLGQTDYYKDGMSTVDKGCG